MCLAEPSARHILFLVHAPSRRFVASNFKQAYSEGWSEVTCIFNANLTCTACLRKCRDGARKQKRTKNEGKSKEDKIKKDPFDHPVDTFQQNLS